MDPAPPAPTSADAALPPTVGEAMNAAFAHAIAAWPFVAVTLAIVIVAFIINRWAPNKRGKLRRAVVLYGLYAIVMAMDLLVQQAGLGEVTWLAVAADLGLAFAVVHLCALAVFDLALPLLSFELPAIVAEVGLGVAYIVAAAAVFSASGVNLTNVVAASTIAAGILTISMQSTLGNVVGGVALQLDGSIKAGDWIQFDDGKQGRVRVIRWRHTVVETRDWDTVIVPNATLLASNITILGKRDGRVVNHRMAVPFHVDFRYPPSRVVQVVQDALRGSPITNVAADPPPDCVCMDFAKDRRESFAVYSARYWILDLGRDDPTSSEVRMRIFTALKRAGIPLARPAMMVFHAPADDEEQKRAEERRRDRALSALRQIELFRVLTDEECERIADHVVYAPFAAGETLTRQGAVAHWLYIVHRGTVEVRTTVEGGGDKVVASISGPGFFGEMGLMTGEPRQASVVARTDVECYRLEKAGFEHIIQSRPEIAAEMSALLAKRRVELIAVREGLDPNARSMREAAEQKHILGRIQHFFGLLE